MRYFILLTWTHEVDGRRPFYARLYAENLEGMAKAQAETHNGVLLEVYQREKDFKTYIMVWDYEFRNRKDEPVPVGWQDILYIVPPSDVMRVGADISYKQYIEMVMSDG